MDVALAESKQIHLVMPIIIMLLEHFTENIGGPINPRRTGSAEVRVAEPKSNKFI